MRNRWKIALQSLQTTAQMLQNHFAITATSTNFAPESLRNRYEIATESLRNRRRIAAESLRNRCGIAGELLWNRRGVAAESLQNRC
jgi:hypothetical protein